MTCSSPNQNTSIVTTTNNTKNETFRIWWPQGFLAEENTLIAQIVEGWQKESGLKASITLIPANLLDSEVVKAVEAGTPPDLLYSTTADTNLFPRLAWKNQLADLSDVINPIKDSYLPVALQTVNYQNGTTKKRGYYAAPIGQQTVHIFYWRNLLEEAGFKDADIPKEWDQYWQFWQTVQQNLRSKRNVDNIYSLGLSMSDIGTDAFLGFEEFLEAYDVKILNEQGSLIIDRPDNRSKIIQALKRYTDFYKNGFVPPSASEWPDSGNNISFLESQSIMTVNSTLSIPLTQKLPKNTYNEASLDLYFNRIATSGFPNRPDGSVLKSILGIKQLVIFDKSKYKEEAKSFMKYFLKPEVLGKFIKEGSKGRMIPVMPQLLEDNFWRENDPHFNSVINQLLKQPSRPSYEAINPAYSVVLEQNIWSKAILRVIRNQASLEQSTDQAIASIKDIFAKWE
ncbi:MAG: ABC transporter substrate-binding protein [Pseudanabaenaceae cyanobacterium bins.39]|nr:ABC transporter substrate-binding protein [Pseudanabaenaceae cyanobacterium bins.39]